MDSPIGKLTILADNKGITEIRFPNKTGLLTSQADSSNRFIKQAIEQLDAYFNGRLKTFDLPLSLKGTDFQQGVWAQLQKIAYGATASYRDVAVAIGNPKASRAVGMANNKNRIPIVIPCHRIIGSDGSLTGFAGGLDTKRWLLNHEKS
ncbi:MAG: methylated-DNA--[protein]-cysteine S-methyltransferase [Porticoccaceae bacterium]|nr:methylated-DNA--[protein]-cysteine S-methyltransferase [Porticoccaceae bacterium]